METWINQTAKNRLGMEISVKKAYVITNPQKDYDLKIVKTVRKLLEKNHIVCTTNEIRLESNHDSMYSTNPEDVDKDTDCIFVIGGDGTLIQAARDLKFLDIPMIGINLGHLGYLAEIEQDKIEERLMMIMQGQYKIESRIMLNGSVYRNGTLIHEDIALNDIVLSRSGNLRIIDFKVYVNNEYLNLYSADGLIVATPTGSTAYNLSAGGPVLEPGAGIMVITPICPHTLWSGSIVLSADSKVTIEICKNRHIDDNMATVHFDGNNTFVLDEGDIIEIDKSSLTTKIMKLNTMSFVEVLHKKMN